MFRLTFLLPPDAMIWKEKKAIKCDLHWPRDKRRACRGGGSGEWIKEKRVGPVGT
jgi:hypothetical protein